MTKDVKDNIIGGIYAFFLVGIFGSLMSVIWGAFLEVEQLIRYGGLFFFTLALIFVTTILVVSTIEI